MSWSVSAGGKRDDVRAAAEQQFDSCAKNYEGNDEGKDIAFAKERTLAILDQLDLTTYVLEGEGPREVSVSCYGSRSSYGEGKVGSAQIHINVNRVEPTPK